MIGSFKIDKVLGSFEHKIDCGLDSFLVEDNFCKFALVEDENIQELLQTVKLI